MMEILPLLVFTTCGGIAAGAYVMNAFCLVSAHRGASDELRGSRAWLFSLVCVVLLGVGLLGTLMHLGQPLRFVNGMANPASMISQESYWAIAFGIVMVIDLACSVVKGATPALVRWIGAVVACGLMVVTGLAYYACLFLPAWSGVITLPLFIVGDLAMGAGLCLALAKADEVLRALHVGNMGVSLAWLAVCVAYGVHLACIDKGIAPVAIGALVGPAAAAVLSGLAISGKMPSKQAGYAVVACAVIGTVCVRGAFFAAGIL